MVVSRARAGRGPGERPPGTAPNPDGEAPPTRSLSSRAGVEARTARGPRRVPRDRRSRRRRDGRRHLARTRRATRRARRSRPRRRRMGCHVQLETSFMRRARSMTRRRWRASLTGDGPTTNAGRPRAAARTSTASRFVAVSSGATRSRPPSIVVSLAPNEKTTRIVPSTASRGRASRSQRERMSREVSRRTPRLYGVSAMPAAWAAATLRPTQPRPVSSPTPATSESPKNKTRTSHTGANHLDMLAPGEITVRVAAPERGSQRTGSQVRVAAKPMGDLELRARRAEPRARPRGRVPAGRSGRGLSLWCGEVVG